MKMRGRRIGRKRIMGESLQGDSIKRFYISSSICLFLSFILSSVNWLLNKNRKNIISLS